ncbi:MAG: hypothetical protein HY744_13875 [Deltaproteobacteria bacterium]|nr:hypothetical protein [Deltaproteobacteria bacterium]
MSEKQIREAIDRVCADLDLRARQRAMRQGVPGALLPLALAAGLGVAACAGESHPVYGFPCTADCDGAAAGHAGAGGAGGTGGEDGGPAPHYMAPDGGEGGGPIPMYYAPKPDGG